MKQIGKKLRASMRKIENIYLEKKLQNRPHWKSVSRFRDCLIWTGSENKIERVIFFHSDEYDSTNFQLIKSLVRPGYVCLDIGANIGIYSMVFSRISGDPANVHAFEPVNHIREKLKANAHLNAFKKININDFALGDKNEQIQMYQVKEGIFRAGTSTFVKNENVQSMGEDKFDIAPVEVKTLDSYVEENDLKQIDFVKIDVEGFELNVLKGGMNSVRKYKPYILLEYDEVRHAPEKEEFRNFFAENAYSVYEFYILEDSPIFIPYDFSKNPTFRNIIAIPKK